jgi:hypothetical protein
MKDLNEIEVGEGATMPGVEWGNEQRQIFNEACRIGAATGKGFEVVSKKRVLPNGLESKEWEFTIVRTN